MKKDRFKMAYYSYVKVNNKMYFSHIFLNGLFEMNLDDFSVKFLGRFPEADDNAFCLHGMGQAIKYKNNIYFFPLNSQVIHCYNLEDKRITIVSLPMKKYLEKDKYFLGTYKWVKENKVWLFSRILSNGVFIFDMDRQIVNRDDMLSDFLSKYKMITNFVETPDGKLYTCCLPDNILIEVDMENRQIKEFPVQIDGIKIGNINYQKGAFWFIDRYTGDVYEQQKNKYIHISVDDEIEWIAPKESPFSACHYVNGEMYIFPSRSKYIMKVSADKTIVKAVSYPPNFCFTNKYDTEICHFPNFGAFEIVNEAIWFHPCKGNQLLIYNTKSNQITGHELFVDTSEIFLCEELIGEREMFSLDYLCSCLKKDKKIDIMKSEFLGKRIYETICSEM